LLSVISCTFFAASGRVGLTCDRDRPLAMGLALSLMAALSGHNGVSQAGDGDPMAPARISALLALAFKVRTTVSFATLECELLNRRSFKNQVEARIAVFDFIEGWYNPHRRHSALDYLSPINYERSRSTAFRTSLTPSTETG
jgi:transposase InsO family protein